MAYFPAHCDNNCKGCDRNNCGWCTWLDRATSDHDTFDHKPFTSTVSSLDTTANFECSNLYDNLLL